MAAPRNNGFEFSEMDLELQQIPHTTTPQQNPADTLHSPSAQRTASVVLEEQQLSALKEEKRRRRTRKIKRWAKRLLKLAIVVVIVLLIALGNSQVESAIKGTRKKLRSIPLGYGILIYLTCSIPRRLIPPIYYLFPLGTITQLFLADKLGFTKGAIVYQLLKLQDLVYFPILRRMFTRIASRVLDTIPDDAEDSDENNNNNENNTDPALHKKDSGGDLTDSTANSTTNMLDNTATTRTTKKTKRDKRSKRGAKQPKEPEQQQNMSWLSSDVRRAILVLDERWRTILDPCRVAQIGSQQNVATKTTASTSTAAALNALPKHSLVWELLVQLVVIVAWNVALYMEDYINLLWLATRSPVPVWWFWVAFPTAMLVELPKTMVKMRAALGLVDFSSGVSGVKAVLGDVSSLHWYEILGVVVSAVCTVLVHGVHIHLVLTRAFAALRRCLGCVPKIEPVRQPSSRYHAQPRQGTLRDAQIVFPDLVPDDQTATTSARDAAARSSDSNGHTNTNNNEHQAKHNLSAAEVIQSMSGHDDGVVL